MTVEYVWGLLGHEKVGGGVQEEKKEMLCYKKVLFGPNSTPTELH